MVVLGDTALWLRLHHQFSGLALWVAQFVIFSYPFIMGFVLLNFLLAVMGESFAKATAQVKEVQERRSRDAITDLCQLFSDRLSSAHLLPRSWNLSHLEESMFGSTAGNNGSNGFKHDNATNKNKYSRDSGGDEQGGSGVGKSGDSLVQFSAMDYVSYIMACNATLMRRKGITNPRMARVLLQCRSVRTAMREVRRSPHSVVGELVAHLSGSAAATTPRSHEHANSGSHEQHHAHADSSVATSKLADPEEVAVVVPTGRVLEADWDQSSKAAAHAGCTSSCMTSTRGNDNGNDSSSTTHTNMFTYSFNREQSVTLAKLAEREPSTAQLPFHPLPVRSDMLQTPADGTDGGKGLLPQQQRFTMKNIVTEGEDLMKVEDLIFYFRVLRHNQGGDDTSTHSDTEEMQCLARCLGRTRSALPAWLLANAIVKRLGEDNQRREYKTMALRLSNLKAREDTLVSRAVSVRRNMQQMERMVYDSPQMERWAVKTIQRSFRILRLRMQRERMRLHQLATRAPTVLQLTQQVQQVQEGDALHEGTAAPGDTGLHVGHSTRRLLEQLQERVERECHAEEGGGRQLSSAAVAQLASWSAGAEASRSFSSLLRSPSAKSPRGREACELVRALDITNALRLLAAQRERTYYGTRSGGAPASPAAERQQGEEGEKTAPRGPSLMEEFSSRSLQRTPMSMVEDLLLDGHFQSATYPQMVALYKRMRSMLKYNRAEVLTQHIGVLPASFVVPSLTSRTRQQGALECLQLLVRLKECAEFVRVANDASAAQSATLIRSLLHRMRSLRTLATAAAFLTQPLQKVPYSGASTSPVLHGLYALNRFVCLERKFRSLSVMVCELCQEHCEEQVSQLLQQMQTAMMEGEELERGIQALAHTSKDLKSLQRVEFSMHGILSDISKNERAQTNKLVWESIREEFEVVERGMSLVRGSLMLASERAKELALAYGDSEGAHTGEAGMVLAIELLQFMRVLHHVKA